MIKFCSKRYSLTNGMECRIFLRKELSQLISLECVVNNCNIPSLLHTIVHPILIGRITIDVPSFTFLTAPSAIPPVSDRRGRRCVTFPRQIFGSFHELQRIVSVNHSRPPHRILCILVSARTTLYPSGSQILYYYRVLMAQSRFVLFTEICVIRCNCVSKCCSLCYPVSSTFKIPPAWSSRHFCALPNNHILGPSENNCINCVFPPDWFRGFSLGYVEEVF